MTDNNHPITPPPELVRQWFAISCGSSASRWKDIVTQAARWGADQELEACSQWIHGWYGNGSREVVGNLYAARRPKPPSLKEQAFAELELLRGDANAHGLGFDAPAIRRALESLPD
jgi:hypothetical protein